MLDSLTYAGNLANLAAVRGRPEFRFVRGDICDSEHVERLLREERVDTLVHFAAESHVDRSIEGPDAFIRTNVDGTHSLLKAARRVWLSSPASADHRFHHVSTDEVYGSLGPDDAPFSEATPYAPNSPYSASKAASDHLVRAYHHTYGLRVTTSNCSNNYGPFHFPEKLIPLTIVNILLGRDLPVYGDGRNVRDWLYVVDHCRAIDLILREGEVGEVYNVGGAAEVHNIDLVRKLCSIADEELAGKPALKQRYPDSPIFNGKESAGLIRFVKDRPGHDRRYAIDFSKAKAKLGFQPAMDVDSGLRAVFRWFVDNESWWRSILDGSYNQWIEGQYGARLTEVLS